MLFTMLVATLEWLFGLNDEAVATVPAFATGGLYAMFAMTTGVGLYTPVTGRWNPSLGELRLGTWGLPINVAAFLWSLFELITIALPHPCATSPDIPWWPLLAVPLVLGGVLALTPLHILVSRTQPGKIEPQE